MPRDGTKHLATSKRAHFVARKSVPEPQELPSEASPKKNSPTVNQVKGRLKKYTAYLVFVDDPKSRAPFAVLQASQITNYKAKIDLENSYLNNSRRKRQYDIAFTNVFKNHTCRIFAKCEPFIKLPVLHEIVQGLNDSYNALMTCKVPVETAYETLIDSNARKVKAGVDYDTGKVINKRARFGRPPDTASSYTEKSDEEDERNPLGDLPRSEQESEDDDSSPTQDLEDVRKKGTKTKSKVRYSGNLICVLLAFLVCPHFTSTGKSGLFACRSPREVT